MTARFFQTLEAQNETDLAERLRIYSSVTKVASKMMYYHSRSTQMFLKRQAKMTPFIVLSLTLTWVPQEASIKTPGPAPQFARVTGVDKDNSQLTIRVGIAVLKSKSSIPEAARRGGDDRVLQPVYVESAHQLKFGEDFTAYDRNADEVSEEDFWSRIKVGNAILVSTHGRQVDEMFRAALRDDTLILVAPPHKCLPTELSLSDEMKELRKAMEKASDRR